MISSTKNKDGSQDLEELADLQSKVKQVKLVEKLGKQGFHYDKKEIFEPITKAVTDSNQKLLEETTSNTKAIENLVESNKYVKTLESMHKIEVIHSSLIRSIAKLLVPKNKSQFRLLVEPDSDKKQSTTNNANVMYESNNNRTLIVGSSNSGKTYQMNQI